MQRITVAAVSLWLALAGSGMAQSDPMVVVELYTSQGCSSCPPADAYLGTIADRDDVIALALHVDYWDYIGWKDIFASPANTLRQKAYAHAAGSRTIYTPQMVIQGRDHVVGNSPDEVARLIAAHMAAATPVLLAITRDGAVLRITAQPGAGPEGPFDMQLVRYRPAETVAIDRGENAGRTMTYHNIVTEWTRLQAWDGASPYLAEAPAGGSDPAVVIVQKPDQGDIVAAARLR